MRTPLLSVAVLATLVGSAGVASARGGGHGGGGGHSGGSGHSSGGGGHASGSATHNSPAHPVGTTHYNPGSAPRVAPRVIYPTRPTQPGGDYRGPVGGTHSYAGHSSSSYGRVVVHDHRGGYYGHGAYGGHRFYYGTHGWAGYSRGYRWGHHRFWRGGVWVWDWGYYYDPFFDGPLYYFDDRYVPDDVAPQPDYEPAGGAYDDSSGGGDAAFDNQGCTYDPNDPNSQPCYDESQAPGIQQPQDPQQPVAPPQPIVEDGDTYYQEGASAPGNTVPQR